MEETQRHQRRAALWAAFPATIPVMTGFLCLGIAYGVLMQSKGYGPGWSVLMSAIAFGGSMQFVAITLLTTAFDPIQAFLLSVMVNARHMFYGLSLLDKYKGLGKVRPFLIYVLCDETFSLVSTLEPPEGVAGKDFYFWISLLDYLYWITGTALGGLLGSFLTFDTTGLDFALTALFVVLFLEQWKKPENRTAGIIGILCAAVSLVVFQADNMVIPAMALVLAVLFGGLGLLFPQGVMSIFLPKGESFGYAIQYLTIVAAGFLITAVDTVYATCMKSAGKTVIPMTAGICSILTNTFLNWILIYGNLGAPALGVRGAAIATVIAAGVSLAINVGCSYGMKLPSAFRWQDWKLPDRAYLTQFAKTVLPVVVKPIASGSSLGVTIAV